MRLNLPQQFLVLFTILALLSSCKQEKTTQTATVANKIDPVEKNTTIYPEMISKMMKSHGGMEQWKKMQQLSFSIGDEKTITALHSRKARVEDASAAIGFDGNQVWLLEKNDKQYEGNATFYYNLMFYFYAMPFVLGDEGIVYSPLPNMEIDGISYPGMLISYQDGVGSSSKDQYKVYVDPETGNMEWLAYTVTYFSKETSSKYNFIHYEDWQTLDGLTLPKTITWYATENSLPVTKRNTVEFSNVQFQKNVDDVLFEMPEGATVVE